MSQGNCCQSLTLGLVQRGRVTPKEQLSLSTAAPGPASQEKLNSSIRRSSCSWEHSLGASPVPLPLLCISLALRSSVRFPVLRFMFSQPFIATSPSVTKSPLSVLQLLRASLFVCLVSLLLQIPDPSSNLSAFHWFPSPSLVSRTLPLPDQLTTT